MNIKETTKNCASSVDITSIYRCSASICSETFLSHRKAPIQKYTDHRVTKQQQQVTTQASRFICVSQREAPKKSLVIELGHGVVVGVRSRNSANLSRLSWTSGIQIPRIYFINDETKKFEAQTAPFLQASGKDGRKSGLGAFAGFGLALRFLFALLLLFRNHRWRYRKTKSLGCWCVPNVRPERNMTKIHVKWSGKCRLFDQSCKWRA